MFPYVPAAGSTKALGIEPLVRVAQHHRSGERGIQRRPVGIARVAIAGAIRADLRREREAAQQRGDPIELPAADQPVPNPPKLLAQCLPWPNGSS